MFFRTVCEWLAVGGRDGGKTGGTGRPRVNVDVKGAKAPGFTKRTGAAAGVMVMPLTAVSVQPVVALV